MRTCPAQRRPGREPRRHPTAEQETTGRGPSLNEGRGVNPGDTCQQRHRLQAMASLNEGRGVNPGDTGTPSASLTLPSIAQRRPGREPRRHGRVRRARHGARPALNEGRGVNPGDTGRCSGPFASCSPLNEGRGVNPGDTIPGRAGCLTTTPLNEGRGVNPGDTLRRPAGCRTAACPLNEGRGVNPGDTRTDLWCASASAAQRRPGREPRRHLASDDGSALPFHAQRRPGREPRRHRRRSAATASRAASLNEGRGVNPGDTRPPRASRRRRRGGSLNEGRGVNPGDTAERPEEHVEDRLRSTKAGA